MTSMHPKICTIVVTYNRYTLLKECIDSLLHQTYPTDIVVIDNASTDGTEANLIKEGYTSFENLCYQKLDTNLGGAGGFHAGCTYASAYEYDFMWLMDDDAEPEYTALEKLIEAISLNASYPAYAPSVFIGTKEKHTLSTFGHRGQFNYKQTLPSFQRPLSVETFLKKTVEIDMASFVGILISSNAMKKIGLPKKEFFIHHDDTEYSLRLATLGKILLVNESKIYHKEKRQNEKIERRFFGFHKNRIRFEVLWLKYYGLRNSIYIAIQYSKTPFVWLDILKLYGTLCKDILLYDDHKWLRLCFATHSILDGLRGNFDNTKAKRLLYV